MLDVRRLRLLRELAVHQTVAATARAMHLTGPAVSQQLAALERQAGVPLLEKHGRTLRLTPAARRLVEHAEVILGSLAAVDAELAAWRSADTGTVTVATFASAGRVLLPALWRRLHADPDFRHQLHIVEREPAAAIEDLHDNGADLAVVYSYTLAPRGVPDGHEIIRLADDPVLLVLHPADAARFGLAPGQPVDLRDLRGARWLLPSPPAACHELIRRACGAAGFVPTPVAVAGDFSVLTALAAAGAGIAAVPRLALPDNTAGLRLHPLASPIIRTIAVVARIGEVRQPRVAAVIDGLREVAGAHDAARESAGHHGTTSVEQR